MLRNHWSNLAYELRSACARTRTFRWRSLCLAGMTVRKNLMGGIVRALGPEPTCSDRLWDFVHSSALDLDYSKNILDGSDILGLHLIHGRNS
jgi:hypothetical protein